QRNALESVFKGKRGGVWATFAGVVSEWLDTQSAPIKVADSGDVRTITVGDVGSIVAEPVRDHRGEKALLMNPPLISPASIERFEISKGAGTDWRDPEMKEWEGVHGGRSTVIGEVGHLCGGDTHHLEYDRSG